MRPGHALSMKESLAVGTIILKGISRKHGLALFLSFYGTKTSYPSYCADLRKMEMETAIAFSG